MFDVQVDSLEAGSRRVFVVRDDRLGGGTKERACRPFLKELIDQGACEFLEATSLKNTSYHRASEEFSEPVTVPPPIPSNTHYDAKLWKFIVGEKGERDLWWNVAR